MANYLNKRKTEDAPRTSYLQRGTGDVVTRPDSKPKYSDGGDLPIKPVIVGPASPDEVIADGFVGFDPLQEPYKTETQEKQDEVSNQTDSPTSEIPDFTAPDKTRQISDLLASGALNSPYFERIRQNQAKLIQLETMPVVDANGRGKSGLKALVEKLAESFDPRYPVRGMGDVYARLTGAVVSGAGGAIVPEWDERADIEREKRRIQKENETLLEYGKADWQYQQQQATLGLNVEKQKTSQQRADAYVKQVDDRIARNKILNLKDEQKSALEPIFKRGYYYEGDNPDEDAKLAGLKIILPDFDNTRKPMVENGVRKAWNPETREYEQVQGTEVDPDDVPLTFQVDGEKITASAKYFLNYKAQKEARQDNQNFQRQMQEDRQTFETRMRSITDENQAVKQVNDAIAEGRRRIANGDLTEEQYQKGISDLINMFAEPVKSKLLQRFQGNK